MFCCHSISLMALWKFDASALCNGLILTAGATHLFKPLCGLFHLSEKWFQSASTEIKPFFQERDFMMISVRSSGTRFCNPQIRNHHEVSSETFVAASALVFLLLQSLRIKHNWQERNFDQSLAPAFVRESVLQHRPHAEMLSGSEVRMMSLKRCHAASTISQRHQQQQNRSWQTLNLGTIWTFFFFTHQMDILTVCTDPTVVGMVSVTLFLTQERQF